MMISECRKAIRAVGTGVFFVANADQVPSRSAMTAAITFSRGKPGCADAAQLVGEGRRALAEGAELLELGAAGMQMPLCVIEVLFAAAGIATGGLQMAASVGADPDIGPSGRNAERLNAVELAAIANHVA